MFTLEKTFEGEHFFAEPEPLEPKLFWGFGAWAGAVISYFGSGSRAESIFLINILNC